MECEEGSFFLSCLIYFLLAILLSAFKAKRIHKELFLQSWRESFYDAGEKRILGLRKLKMLRFRSVKNMHRMFLCMNVCMYVCLYVCMYVCMYMYSVRCMYLCMLHVWSLFVFRLYMCAIFNNFQLLDLIQYSEKEFLVDALVCNFEPL